MNKKKQLSIAVGLGLILIANVANSATTSSAVKNGKMSYFMGVERSYDTVKYTHYLDNQDPVYTSVGENYSHNLILGARYYVNKYVGFGLKGWAGYTNYDHFFSDGKELHRDFFISSESIPWGAEAQLYLDFINISTSALGVTLGAGYEQTQFYNGVVTTEFINGNNQMYRVVSDIPSYKDNTLVWDAALHLQLGSHNRFEIGYKIKDYSKTVMPPKKPDYQYRVVGFNVKSSLYANYSFSF